MSQGLFYGSGFLCIETKGAIKKGFFPAAIDFSLDGASEEVTAKGFVGGREVITGAALKGENYTMKLGFEALTWLTLQLVFGRLAATSLNIQSAQVRTKRIDSAGEINDPDILAVVTPAFLAQVIATNNASDTILAEAAPATAASALTPGQFKIDRTANKLIFNPSQAGRLINYRVITQVPSIETLGLELGTEQLDLVSFSGLAYGSGGTKYGKLVVPEMARIKVPSLSFAGSATKAEVEYRVNQTDASELPWYIEKLH
jgi:hypothetical protein